MLKALRRFACRVAQLLDELRFARASGATMRDSATLVLHTSRFHLHHHRKAHHSDTARPFCCRLKIADRVVPLTLRPFSGDLFVLYEILKDRVYSIPSSLLPENEVQRIVDCGANIGLTALCLADRYPNAKIIAVEPHPDNFRLLRQNTAIEPRIKPIQACVVGAADQERFISTDRPSWGNCTNSDGLGVRVACKTVQQLLGDNPSLTIDLLKIDIEGAEKELFSHPAFLQQTRLVIIELHGDYGIDELRRDVEPMGFEVFEPTGDLRMVTVRSRAAMVAQLSS